MGSWSRGVSALYSPISWQLWLSGGTRRGALQRQQRGRLHALGLPFWDEGPRPRTGRREAKGALAGGASGLGPIVREIPRAEITVWQLARVNKWV